MSAWCHVSPQGFAHDDEMNDSESFPLPSALPGSHGNFSWIVLTVSFPGGQRSRWDLCPVIQKGSDFWEWTGSAKEIDGWDASSSCWNLIGPQSAEKSGTLFFFRFAQLRLIWRPECKGSVISCNCTEFRDKISRAGWKVRSTQKFRFRGPFPAWGIAPKTAQPLMSRKLLTFYNHHKLALLNPMGGMLIIKGRQIISSFQDRQQRIRWIELSSVTSFHQ